MWSVTLRLLWFYPNFHDFRYGLVLFSVMPSVTSLVSSKRAHYTAVLLFFLW